MGTGFNIKQQSFLHESIGLVIGNDPSHWPVATLAPRLPAAGSHPRNDLKLGLRLSAGWEGVRRRRLNGCHLPTRKCMRALTRATTSVPAGRFQVPRSDELAASARCGHVIVGMHGSMQTGQWSDLVRLVPCSWSDHCPLVLPARILVCCCMSANVR